MADRLIITNGDSAVARMREAGLEADFLPWRDMLHAGPVPRAPSLEELSNIRARYLAEEFAPDPADVDRGFAERDAAIRNHAKYDRVELWFEHDLYDQLQLIHSRSRRLRRRRASWVTRHSSTGSTAWRSARRRWWPGCRLPHGAAHKDPVTAITAHSRVRRYR